MAHTTAHPHHHGSHSASADAGRTHDHAKRGNHEMHRHPYRAFAIEMGVDFVIMYLVMYTMIASFDHLYLNVNNLYMTLMMVAPMAIVMLIGMRRMFPSRTRNLVIGAVAALVFVASFAAMRKQTAVGNEQFLRSMIPHHSGAVLMCEEAKVTDPEIVRLCDQIIRSQKAEIAQMEQILARY